MSEDRTKKLPASHSFESRVMARLDAIDGRLTNIETRLENLEAKKYETKPIWERALKEISETRIEMNARFEELESSISVLAGDILKVRAREKSSRYKRQSTIAEDVPEKKRA